MQPREPRFWLRFESGDRQGETVPLAEGTIPVGRRSANQVVVADGSVSGFHAELHVREDGVEVVDLESTNGTKVDGKRIERAQLAHGDRVSFGHIETTLVDRKLATPDAPGAPEPAGAGELERVDPQGLRSAGLRPGRRRRVLLPLLLLVVVALGVAAVLYFRHGGRTAVVSVQVPAIPGNHVVDASFEKDGAWETSSASTAAFEVDASFARSGALGLGVTFEEPGWAYAEGPALPLALGRGLALAGWLQSGEGTRARIGLAFTSSAGGVPPFVAWSRDVEPADDFAERDLLASPPPGYDRVAVAVAARGAGWASLDDVSLVDAPAPAPLARSEFFEAYGYGPGAATLTLVRAGHVVFPSLSFGAFGPEGPAGEVGGTWHAEAWEKGLRLQSVGAPDDAVLHVLAIVGDDGDGGGGLLATLGPDGYRAHASALDVEHADDVLLGRGYDLVRLGLGGTARAEGHLQDGVLALDVQGAAGHTLELQDAFAEERTRAAQLERQAQASERAGKPGEALATWQRLLDELPYEANLVQQAEAARARLTQAGLDRVDVVRKEVERARFFDLADLYEQCRGRAQEIASQYAGTEVAKEAHGVIETVDGELLALRQGATSDDRTRIEGVLEALSEQDEPALRAHVQQALNALEEGHAMPQESEEPEPKGSADEHAEGDAPTDGDRSPGGEGGEGV